MAVKHRCGFCRKVLRADGTCANPDCPRYVPDKPKEEEPTQKTPSDDTTTPTTGGNE